MSNSSFQTLGRYTLHTELGKGGFATVYRAMDSALDREVALKILKPGWTDDPKAVERFMREAKLAARLKHPNIVTIFDVGQAEGRLFIAMELVPGRSLQRVVAEDGPLSWSRALTMLEQAASALDYAHKQGLVHRDIKPANLILDEHEASEHIHVVLTDFGLVRGAEQASLSTGSTGGLIGTPEYIAPEIWDGEAATQASDLYALGCVAYFLLTGKVLFGATTPMAVLKRHVEGPIFPAQWSSDVPDGVEMVLRGALAKDQSQRPATAGQFVTELRECEASEARKRQEEAERAAQAALALEVARKANEEQEARRKMQEEVERAAQAALALEAVSKAKEEAKAKAKQEAEEQERQRQVPIAAQEKTKHEAEEKVKRDDEVATVKADAVSLQKDNVTDSTSVTLTKTTTRTMPRKLFVMPILSIVLAVWGELVLISVNSDDITYGIRNYHNWTFLLTLYGSILIFACVGFLVGLIQDSRKKAPDGAALRLLDKSLRVSVKTWGLWVTATAFSAFALYSTYMVKFDDYLWWCILVLGVVGVSQWLVLRKHVDLFGYWVIVTLLGGSAAVLLSWAFIADIRPSIFVPLGVFVGLGQWLILRNKVYGAGWWILASIIGWSGLTFRLWFDLPFSGIASSVFLGAITGTVWIWLLRHPKPIK